MDVNEKVIDAIRDLVRKQGIPLVVPEGNTPYALVPNDCKLEDLSRFIHNENADRPRRIKGVVQVLDPDSFMKYYTLFADESSRVFAYEPDSKVIAVLDYHEANTASGAPRWGWHKLVLTLQKSEEWKVWTESNNTQMTQAAFGEFLEQNAVDITKPASADMVEVARDLEATTEMSFGSAQRAQDGQVKWRYTEETKATVGGGTLAVPERFTITLPAFVGGTRVPIEAFLRFRVKEGKLTFWYTLVRPHEVLRTAFLAARDSIAAGLSVTIINGVCTS